MPNHLRLLLLEDQQADAELVLHELRRDGFELDWQYVQTEADFLACLDPAPDIIISDYYMPQFTAERALELLKERAVDVPCIVVSGAIGEEIAVSTLKKGAADYLLKDRLVRLGPAVRYALEQKRLHASVREVETALMSRVKWFRALIENSTDGIATMGPEGNVTFVSPATTRILGYHVEEMPNGNFFELVHPDDVEFAKEQFAALLAEPGRVICVEVRLRHKDTLIAR